MKQAAVFLIFCFSPLWGQELLRSRFDDFRGKEQYAEMVKFFDQSPVDSASLNSRERTMLIEAYFKLHEYAKAFEMGTEAFENDPISEDTAFMVLESARRVAKRPDALRLGLSWVSKHPPSLSLYDELSVIYSDLNDHRLALKYAAAALELSPKDPDAMAIYVYALACAEGAETAKKYYREIENKNALTTHFYTEYAEGLCHESDFSDVLAIADQVLSGEPGAVDLSRMKVQALRSSKKIQEAIDYASKWIEHYQPDFDWYNQYAVALHMDHNYTAAEKFVRKSIDLNEWYPTAIENLLVTLNDQDKYGAAIQFAAEWKYSHPDAWTPKMDHMVGNAYLWLNLYDMAHIYYLRAYEAGLRKDALVRDLMYVLHKLGRSKEAIAIGEKWQTDGPSDSEIGGNIVKKISEYREDLKSTATRLDHPVSPTVPAVGRPSSKP